MEDSVHESSDKITNTINKREHERKLDLEKRREGKMKISAQNEKIDYFTETFENKRSGIEDDLKLSTDVNPQMLPDHFDNISKQILSLQKYVASSNIFLRTYDIKIFNECLQDLSLKARQLEDKLLPKKKFGFRVKKPIMSMNGHLQDTVDFCRNPINIIDLSDSICGFDNRINETLLLKSNQVLKKDVTLRNLEGCVIKIFGAPSTLHISQLKNCLVLCGPVSTSIFAENCTASVFVIACQQFRLHSSSNLQIYLHVTSRAILEDCEDISVAPFNFKYEDIDEDFVTAGLDRNCNNWTLIGDFNWLNTEIKSPHWSVLDIEKRICDWEKFSLTVN